MGIRFSVLASGSTGNAMVVATEDTKVLVDAGLSAKKVDSLLKEKDISAADLDAILVTHEHADHIKGLGAIARKYDLPVYANEKTWDALDKQIGDIAEDKRCVMQTGEARDFGTLRVESYGISHDAAEPVGYCFYNEDQKLSLATDLGYMSEKVKEQIRDSDVMVLESNHDIEMLRVGRYPWNIKRRILSDLGHLSNEAAGIGLCDVMTSRTKRVYLAHLSRDHNMMDLARLTVNNMVEERLCEDDHRAELMDTYYDRATAWDRLDEE
ncbi:MBL fold metallo-hydrolase [Paenibacillus xerothermodurans]|uniref:MBL fold metallo-hydrolase n=1 Tax=Paenibacillus xerothermodurans TaxID=1977292 RepID=A0A2W1N3Y0_PAEXE|nr:MBL fold metallo-hydrolase [Paenibacillus xerothermodurans]PZE19057.1 MBL fold metallo-hydrolase [Paenibacillus xerothermodurans]